MRLWTRAWAAASCGFNKISDPWFEASPLRSRSLPQGDVALRTCVLLVSKPQPMLVAAAMLNESYASLICGSWYASNMEHINHQEQISFKACLSSLTTSRNLLI